MKILLTAINAKYIHSNLAVYNLQAYAKQYSDNKMARVEIAEYTINQQFNDILMNIYEQKPDVIGFSCYIWNIEFVRDLVENIGKILPQCEIWLGGPEVSYCAKELLEELKVIKGIAIGEGEETFKEIVEYYDTTREQQELSNIKGIAYRAPNGEVKINEQREIMDLTKVPFVYEDITAFEHKIIYYESSRGCPFSCSYCLSSIDKKLRFRDTEVVKKEIGIFLEHKVKQVKFVDRTFNCDHRHSMEIWSYIKEHDNGITNFHFEIAADLLTQEEMNLIASMRKGLIQLEIGVQSTHLETIREIKRVMDFKQVCEIVEQVQRQENIHQHLDLIAGLPYETLEIFKKSFNDVYLLYPEQLQLGFLKVLKGSYMHQKREDYGLVYQSKPPYEVLFNNWMSFDDILLLKGVEEMLEVYYNSGQFVTTMRLLELEFETPFSMYEQLSEYYEAEKLRVGKHTRVARYEILFRFISNVIGGESKEYYQSLVYDLFLREQAKTRPDFAKEYQVDKELVRRFFEQEEQERKYLKGYEAFDKRQMSKMTHVERLGGRHILFDYKNRNPLTNEATTFVIEEVMELK